MAGTDQTSKIERFDYFQGALHLGCLVSSGCATVYLTTYSHIAFSGVTMARHLRWILFPNILNGF